MKIETELDALLYKQTVLQAKAKSSSGKVNTAALAQFSKSLAQLLAGGVPLLKALTIIESSFKKSGSHALVEEVKKQTSQGKSLSDSLANFSDGIPAYFIQALKAGELCGNTDLILEELAVYLEKQEGLKKKLWMTASYPLFIVAAAVLTLAVLGKMVFPKIMHVYDDFGASLPIMTQVVLYMVPWLFPAAVFLLGSAAFAGWFYWKKGELENIFSMIPGCRGLIKRIILIRFTRLGGLLLESGIPIMETIQMIGNTFESKRIHSDLVSLKKELSKGERLSHGLTGKIWIDPLSCMLIAAGEESGQLAPALLGIAKHQEAQLDVELQTLMKLVEPALILAVGLIVGFMVIAMVLPIFEIGSLMS